MEKLFNELKFDDRGLIPVVTQDNRTDEVLMLAYMNREALEKTLETGKVYYWSRSRWKLWLKGETSGHFQHVKSISYDCDGDTILIKAEQKGAACHTGHHSCFYRKLDFEAISGETVPREERQAQAGTVRHNIAGEDDDKDLSKVLKEVYNIVVDRKANPKEGSYTNYLFQKGLDKILKKVGEEAAEVIIASKNTDSGNIKCEIADLMYHLCVLMVEKGVGMEDVFDELKGRR